MPPETEITSPEAPDTVPAEEEAVQTDEATEQPRDEQGQYASPEDQPPLEEPAEEQAPSEAPEAQAAEAEEGAPTDEGTPAAEYEAFEYVADGQPYPIDGSMVGEDGVFIPTEQVPHTQQLLAAGRHHLSKWQEERADSQRQVQEAQAIAQGYQAQVEVITRQYGELMALDDEALLVEAEKFRREWPATKARSEQAFLEMQSRADRTRLEQYEQAEAYRRIAPMLSEALDREITAFGADPRFEGLAHDDLVNVYAYLWQNAGQNQVFVEHEGQWYTNRPVIEQQLQYVARLKQGEAKSAAKKTAAKKTNKGVTEGKTPPPVVSAKGGPAPTGKVQKAKDYSKLPLEDQTREVLDDYF